MGSCLLHLLPSIKGETSGETSAMGEISIVESDNGTRGTRRERGLCRSTTVELAGRGNGTQRHSQMH